MNTIYQKQNTTQNLKLLAAQRQLYSNAKDLQTTSILISIFVAIILPILSVRFPLSASYIALAGIVLTLTETLYSSRLRKCIQEKAANIQQIFDCSVLQFDWESLDCGNHIEPEIINDASDKYKRKYKRKYSDYFKKLRNWYLVSVEQLTNFEQLPVYEARILCQRSNVGWDIQLRRRYCQWIFIIFVFLAIFAVLIGLIERFTIEKFLVVVIFPLLPASVIGLSQYLDNNEAATKLDFLKKDAETLFQQVKSGIYTVQDLEKESYSLQRKIYDHRRSSPLIPNWFYSIFRNEDDEKMNKTLNSLVQELMEKRQY
jgi:hypothetical protein